MPKKSAEVESQLNPPNFEQVEKKRPFQTSHKKLNEMGSQTINDNKIIAAPPCEGGE